jgi:hypothetical protein
VEKSDEQPSDRPGRGSDKFPLRFPDGLRDRIKASAAENGRTMNAEIIARLERYPSLGGEVDAMWEVARALADEIDKVAGPEFAGDPLFDKINSAFAAVSMDTGEVDRAKLGREYGVEAAKRLSKPDDKEALQALRKALQEQGETFVQFLRAVADDDKKVVQDMLDAHKHHLARFTRDQFFSEYVMTMAGIDDPDRLARRVAEANIVARQNGLDLVVDFEAEGNERSVSMRDMAGPPLRRMIMWDVLELEPGERLL